MPIYSHVVKMSDGSESEVCSALCRREVALQSAVFPGSQSNDFDGLPAIRTPYAPSPEPQAARISGKPKLNREGLRLSVGLNVSAGQDTPIRHINGTTEVRVPLKVLIEENIDALPLRAAAICHGGDGSRTAVPTRNLEAPSASPSLARGPWRLP